MKYADSRVPIDAIQMVARCCFSLPVRTHEVCRPATSAGRPMVIGRPDMAIR